ncbi:hypothetical protein OPT61_g3355 [Boeremia exigua]|uniref:Uncharacterized protein n=1 Tax=Boeremia exigua TaxID=749465 RepID=A0ACC2IIA3_9PLEO|nr:hypothetical protein OPT61_g3355 [Boeremia exigua]
MSNQFNLPSLNLVLPTITTLLGLTGLTTGAATVLSGNPIDAIRPFGLRPVSSDATIDASPFTRALIYTYATRNIGVGLTTLGLTIFWKMQPANSISATIGRRCLGLSMLLGTVIGVGDAILVSNFADSAGYEESIEARKSSFGHAVAASIVLGTGGLLFWM